jgi:hypothetical protein
MFLNLVFMLRHLLPGLVVLLLFLGSWCSSVGAVTVPQAGRTWFKFQQGQRIL